jgi:hypothetical protein
MSHSQARGRCDRDLLGPVFDASATEFEVDNWEAGLMLALPRNGNGTNTRRMPPVVTPGRHRSVHKDSSESGNQPSFMRIHRMTVIGGYR